MAEQTYMISSSEGGNVCIAADVFQSIISAAVCEVDGVADLATGLSADVSEYLGVKTMPKGIRVTQDEGGMMRIDIVLTVRYGCKVSQVAERVQQSVVTALHDITGLDSAVNVHVTGISFEKKAEGK